MAATPRPMSSRWPRSSPAGARACTARTTALPSFPNRHEPGDVTLRGRTYPPTSRRRHRGDPRSGARSGHRAPHRAQICDPFHRRRPAAESVARLEKIFNETGGDLKALAHAVVEDPNAWKPGPGKMRTPVEYVTAGYRLLDLPKGDNADKQVRGAIAATRLMGEFPWRRRRRKAGRTRPMPGRDPTRC